MRRTWIMMVLFLCIAVSLPSVRADRGMISVSPGVSVYEPGQKAIIAWNGQKEIMILSTDVNSSQETMVLEILPLPSKPEVETATFQCFEQIQSMIWEEGIYRFMYSNKDAARSGSVEVLLHTQIGAHNITVVKATDSSELVNWSRNFLAESGVNQSISLGSLEPIVEDYMGRGFRYYVLDLIAFSQTEKSINPILYRFDSSFLYYPLLITSPVGGDSKITLFLITEDKVDMNYVPMQKAVYRIREGTTAPIEFLLSAGDVSKIDLRMGELFPEGGWLTVLTYDGRLDILTKDLMLSKGAQAPDVHVEVTVPSTLIVLCFILGAASALGGVVAALLITRSKKT